MVKNTSNLSRAVSHALRHEPWLYEIELDDDGWVSVENVIFALRKESSDWVDLSEVDLAQMIKTSTKRRHEITDGQIRAIYGHSIPGKLKRTPAIPPDLLFHGTDPSLVPHIKLLGLLPMGRQYVHLTADTTTALEVGRRKTNKPTILQVSAADAHANGIVFYEGNDKVWLADHVFSQFIVFEDNP